jgi:V8-like Glu-specific endopeptidase
MARKQTPKTRRGKTGKSSRRSMTSRESRKVRAAKKGSRGKAKPVRRRTIRARKKQQAETGALVAHYRAVFARGAEGKSSLESMETAGPDDTDSLLRRADSAAESWHRIVKTFLDDDPRLHDVADQIAGRGKRALKVLASGYEAKIARDQKVRADLEVIAQTDGSRPTFVVQNGKVSLDSSPVGGWEAKLNASAGMLERALACVGRIDHDSLPQGFAGTGFLVQENLIITNRHVLEEIGKPDAHGNWNLKKGVAIDFGHEFRARDTVARRMLRKVVFCGPDPIDRTIDHAHLDLALIETDPPAPGDELDYYLGVDISPDWAARDQDLYVVGYPGSPRFGDEDQDLLDKLFRKTYGHKRCAPGVISRERTKLPDSPRSWSLAHDATTLRGNSGSAILAFTRETICAGLHYGGARGTPRENWGHVLGLTLDSTDGRSARTLRQHLQDAGVELIDPFGS